MGIKVLPVLSDPLSGWSGHTGYVQDSFKSKSDIVKPNDIVAVAAGHQQLAEVWHHFLLFEFSN